MKKFLVLLLIYTLTISVCALDVGWGALAIDGGKLVVKIIPNADETVADVWLVAKGKVQFFGGNFSVDFNTNAATPIKLDGTEVDGKVWKGTNDSVIGESNKGIWYDYTDELITKMKELNYAEAGIRKTISGLPFISWAIANPTAEFNYVQFDSQETVLAKTKFKIIDKAAYKTCFSWRTKSPASNYAISKTQEIVSPIVSNEQIGIELDLSAVINPVPSNPPAPSTPTPTPRPTYIPRVTPTPILTPTPHNTLSPIITPTPFEPMPQPTITITPTPTPMPTPTVIYNGKFTDLEEAQWAEQYIKELYTKGIVNGKSETKFSPLDNVKREEYVKMLVIAFGLSGSKIENFTDVEDADWYAPYIKTALACRIISDTNLFGVGRYITREEMATMTYRTLKFKNIADYGTLKTEFTDKDLISPWAVASVESMCAMGIINGFNDSTFRPKDTANRAQSAKIIAIAMKQ